MSDSYDDYESKIQLAEYAWEITNRIKENKMSREAMKYTPGPWTFYDDSNDGKTNRIEIVAIGKTVARIYHSVPAEDLPNARLIAAAPDLLDALLMVLDDPDALDGRPRTYEYVRAAIAKATGEKS